MATANGSYYLDRVSVEGGVREVRTDFDCYDDAITELHQAKAIIEGLSELVYEHGRHLSDMAYAAQCCVERGLTSLDLGRVRGE